MDTALLLKIVFMCVFIYSLAPTLLIRLGRVEQWRVRQGVAAGSP